MKKFLIITATVFMILLSTVVPVKADTVEIEVPYHAVFDDSEKAYIIFQYQNEFKLMTTTLDRPFTYTNTGRLFTYDGMREYNLDMNSNKWVFERTREGTTNNGYRMLLYSSHDLYDSAGDSLNFQKKTVLEPVMLVIRTETKNLLSRMMADSGEILAVGGVILGVLLVVQLVRRLPYWAMR